MEKYKVDFNSIPWQEKAPGFKLKEYEANNKKLRLVEFSDELFEKEWCENGHLGYIIEGKIKVNFFNGNIVEFKKNDFINIPAGEENKHKAEMEKGKKVLVLFFI